MECCPHCHTEGKIKLVATNYELRNNTKLNRYFCGQCGFDIIGVEFMTPAEIEREAAKVEAERKAIEAEQAERKRLQDELDAEFEAARIIARRGISRT